MNNLPYKNIILENIPRLLSLEDRNPLSPTYGCFDRSFWHLKFITDFPSAHYQENALILALIYKNNFKGNKYYNNPQILKWAKAALVFWTKIQNKDGSFNEAYPNEHSFVATAFSLYSLSETYLLLENHLSKKEKTLLIKSFRKAANWLNKHDDLIVCNHQAGAIAALYNIYLITKEKEYLKTTQKKLNLLLKEQKEEGWFPEYGGADLGYLSMTIDYLAKYYQKNKDSSLLEPLKKAIDFMAYFIGPDGTFGGSYNSRGTHYLCPLGLEILAEKINSSRYILNLFYKGLERGTILTPSNMDERYTGFFLSKYLQAFLNHKDLNNKEERFSLESIRNFTEAKLLVINNENYHAVIGYNKNGVIKIVPQNDPINYINDGVLITLKDGRIVTSQWLNKKPNFKISNQKNSQLISISSNLNLVNYDLPLRKFLVPFRLFNYLFCQNDRIAQFLARCLKSYKIKQRKINIEFLRNIILKKNSILIEDVIKKPPQVAIKEISIGNKFCPITTSSANYFEGAELNQNLIPVETEKKIIIKLNKNNFIRLSEEIVFKPNFKIKPYLING
jgi:hypothetical protein